MDEVILLNKRHVVTPEEQEFQEMFIAASSEVADEFYPKGVSKRRGEFLRDQAVLFVKLSKRMKEVGYLGH